MSYSGFVSSEAVTHILLSDTEQADHVYETKVKCQDNAFGQLGSNKRMLIGCIFFYTLEPSVVLQSAQTPKKILIFKKEKTLIEN